MNRLEGKVAFVTGAARGQGRSHALRLAEEGADIIAVDLCAQIDSVPYPMGTPDDLRETQRLIEEHDRRVIAEQADVRSFEALKSIVDRGVAEFGRLDVVCANAGIFTVADSTWEIEEQGWQDVIDVNLTGVWHTVKAAVPHMIAAGNGGAIVITSSTAGLKGLGGATHYVASKHGVIGIMRSLAMELAPHSIRVNTVHPTGVNTPMVVNEFFGELMQRRPEMGAAMQNPLPVEMVEPVDISNAIVWLASDEARYVTGVTLPVDAGFTAK
jgi:SDR family mycofactocin-dependent oxidoreductase